MVKVRYCLSGAQSFEGVLVGSHPQQLGVVMVQDQEGVIHQCDSRYVIQAPVMVGYVERYGPAGGYSYGNRKVFGTRRKNESGEVVFDFTYTPSGAGMLSPEWQEKFKAFALANGEKPLFMSYEEFEAL
jgi:hypothetical protein